MNIFIRLPKEIQRLIDTLIHAHKQRDCLLELFTTLKWSDRDDGFIYHGFLLYNHRVLKPLHCRTNICKRGFDWEIVDGAYIPKRYIYSCGKLLINFFNLMV